MSTVIEITDIAAPELDLFARLTEAELRSRREPEKGVFIAESAKVIRVALEAGCVPRAFLMSARHLRGQGLAFMDRCPDTPVFTAEDGVLASLTGYALSRGMLCAMDRPRARTVEDICAGARRAAVLEDVTDAVNIGAIFRSAAALGVDAVLLTERCCDPLNRRAARVSMGTVLQVPWAYMDGRTENGLARLRELGFQSAALALDERAIDIDDPALADIPRLALVLGTEGDGLADRTVAACDWTVRIPMKNGVDSLNVAAAGAVAFWQLRARD